MTIATLEKPISLAKPIIRSFEEANDTKTIGKLRVDVLRLDDKSVSRSTMEPGFRCTEATPPTNGFMLCEMEHIGFLKAGRLRIRTEDDAEYDILPGSVFRIPAGHDGWVEGEEPAVVIDLEGGEPKI